MTIKDCPASTDVAVIGAGPSGAVVAALLAQRGHKVTVLEKLHFPRFSIGESLLPQCMEFIAEANMLDAVEEAGFQFKNGAAFTKNGVMSAFDFTEKFSAGAGTTFQVQRGKFDHLLAQEAGKAGANIFYGHTIEAVTLNTGGALLNINPDVGDDYQLQCRFLLDASGFGRTLPRLLNLDTPSDFPVRMSLFTHIQDNISDPKFDRNKILITINPENKDIWYWLIPFADGRSSVGVVAEPHYFTANADSLEKQLKEFIAKAPDLQGFIESANFDTPVQKIAGYSSNVKSLWGKNFALLGNAGEFLDPVFSSGVTIAMCSASMAAPLVSRELDGEAVDWQAEYTKPLMQGVDTFRTFVEAWYDGRFQDVIFAENQSDKIREMISSILAGYAWDTKNPYVADSERRLNTLVELCRG